MAEGERAPTWARRLELLEALTRHLARPAEIEPLLAAVGPPLLELAAADGACVVLLDERREPRVSAAFGWVASGPPQAAVAVGRGAAIQAIARRAPVLLTAAPVGEDKLPAGLAPADVAMVGAVPLLAGDECLGALELHYQRPDEEWPGRLPWLQVVASSMAQAVRAVQERAREWFVLADLGRSLTAQASLSGLEVAVVEGVQRLVEPACVELYQVDEEGVAQLTLHGNEEGVQSPPSARTLALPRTGEVWVEPHPACPSCGRALGEHGGRVGVPLRLQRRLIGALALYFPDLARFTQARRWLLTSTADQIAVTIRNAQLYLWSEQLAITEERARIAREIHDGLLQSLAAKLMRVDLCQRLLEREPARVAAELAELRESLRADIQEVRHSILNLRPLRLEREGLAAALRGYASELAEECGWALSLALDEVDDLSPKLQTAVFRIVQEALNNVRKHAAARQVGLELRLSRASLRVVVQDDGRGFDPRLVQRGSLRGIGLHSMQERARSAGGSLTVRSMPGTGTRIELRLPLGSAPGQRIQRGEAARGGGRAATAAAREGADEQDSGAHRGRSPDRPPRAAPAARARG